MTDEKPDATTDEEPAAAEPKPAARKRAPARKKAAKPAEAPAATGAEDEAKAPRKRAAAKEAPGAEAKAPRKRTAAKEAPAAEPVAEEPTPAPGAGESEIAEPAAVTPAGALAAASKAAAAAPSGPVEVHAYAKYVRTSARKARLVCDHIRGKSVDEAYAILAHTPRHVARDWQKLLRSAVANAEHNHELLGENLRISSVHADEGPTLKRFRPRAMGRASSIHKRTSHLSITLAAKE